MLTMTRNSIFTNVAHTPDNDVWWEAMTPKLPEKLVDWLGQEWTPGCGRAAAHPNARFTTPAGQCPVIDAAWEDPKGVPISAFLFGGRRATVIPLVTQSFSWRHGTFLGATASSEKTAAAAGKVGELRRDPFAMLPFCGYNMGDYFGHWLKIGAKTAADKLPKIFYVNWFRKSSEGKFLWPGYGENSRVLKWVFERVCGEGGAVETPIGYLPTPESLDLKGLDIPADSLRQLLCVDTDEWKVETDSIQEHLDSFGDRMPEGLREELAQLRARLKR
jgi:phosphoenolpyruvate carboxykinase (GTP)